MNLPMMDGMTEKAGCMTVPLAALAVPGEDDSTSQPVPGDRVSYQVDGVVESVNGDQAEVRPSAINGNPVGEPESAEAPDEGREQLMAQAGQMGGL